MLLVYGALLSLFPADLPLLELRSDDWRRECGIPIRKPRDAAGDFHKRAAVAFAREQWLRRPSIDDNGADAFWIAYAGRQIWLRQELAA
jgi:hypothetical protein